MFCPKEIKVERTFPLGGAGLGFVFKEKTQNRVEVCPPCSCTHAAGVNHSSSRVPAFSAKKVSREIVILQRRSGTGTAWPPLGGCIVWDVVENSCPRLPESALTWSVILKLFTFCALPYVL